LFCFQVVNEYEKHGFEFLCRAFNDPLSLEDLTGLTQMKEAAADVDFLTWDSDDEEFGDL
jgi:hypothetical protein